MELGGLFKGLNKALIKDLKRASRGINPQCVVCTYTMYSVHDVLHNLLLRDDRANDCSHESLINRH